jgi:DNA-binding phage protein
MTTIAPTTAPSSITHSVPQRSPGSVMRTDPMAGVARALGLSREELNDRLSSGKNLTEIAQAQGVRNEQLLSTIQTGAPTGKAPKAQAVGPVTSIGELSGSWQYARESGGAVTGMLITAGGTASSPRLQQLSAFLGADPAALRARFAGGDTLLGVSTARSDDPEPVGTTPVTSLPLTASSTPLPELTGPDTGASVSTARVQSTALANSVSPRTVAISAEYASAAAATTTLTDDSGASTVAVDLRSVLRPGDLFDVRV